MSDPGNARAAVKRIVRLDVSTPEKFAALKGALRSFDVAGRDAHGRFLDLVTTPTQRDQLTRAGVPFTTLPQPTGDLRAAYHSFAQMETALANLAAAHPAITNLFSIGQSFEGRTIWCLEISDNPGVDEGEPGVQFMGLTHAREWPALEVPLDIAERLAAGYGSDPTITSLVNGTRIWIIPCSNPDGYAYDYNTTNMWRKNRRPVSGAIGVDLNRNYDGGADGRKDGAWGSIGTGAQSHNPSQDTYVGPLPFSEPETQAIRDFFATRDITISISYHTYSQLVLWPWGGVNATTDDNALMSSIGQGMASAIGGYTPQQSIGLYPTTGASDDWIYGYRYYELGKNTLAYTVEIGTEFHPSASALQPLLDENWAGARYVLQQAASAEAQLTPFVLPPTTTPPVVDADGDYTVTWAQTNPGAGANLYALQELTGLSTVTEGAEGATTAWNLEQFATSSVRSHTGTKSFKSPAGDEKIAAMTTIDPLPVALGDTLSFWTWYDIETDWDMGFVEVSRDGRQFDVLDTFTGSSGGWVQKNYSLDAYAGASVYLRFRYTTDSSVTGEGFYVDDISPVASWGGITTLASNIAGTSYVVSGRADGDYYYRVKGSNPARGFGAYSGVRMTRVYHGLADSDGDGDHDLNDFAAFQLCYEGGLGCPVAADLFDLNVDGVTDLADLAIFADCLGGPGTPAPGSCPF